MFRCYFSTLLTIVFYHYNLRASTTHIHKLIGYDCVVINIIAVVVKNNQQVLLIFFIINFTFFIVKIHF